MNTPSVDTETRETIRLIIADDHPLVREALRNSLDKQPDFKVVAEAENGEDAVELATQLKPDVVLMDIGMPILNGLEATRSIKERCPAINILVFTVHNDIEHILGILQAGASGYLTKSAYSEEVVNTIRALVLGETVLSSNVYKQVFKYINQHQVPAVKLEMGERLSSRELEVLKFVAKGVANKEIAARLGISLRTVKGYLADIFLKLGAASRTEAITVSLRKGIISIDDLD